MPSKPSYGGSYPSGDNMDDGQFDFPMGDPLSPFGLPFPDKGPKVAPLRCFASFFEDAECKDAPKVCRVMSDAFDEESCTNAACMNCQKLEGQQKVSAKLQSYCASFTGQFCLPNVMRAEEDGSSESLEEQASVRTSVVFPQKKCFKKVLKTVPSLCVKKLPPNEKCVRGCRSKTCFKKVYTYSGPCKDKLPSWCAKRKERVCKFTKTVKKTCKRPGKKTCLSKVKESYGCKKKKVVKKPCPRSGSIFGKMMDKFEKKCKKAFNEKYVCGSKTQTKITSCSQRSTRLCVPKFCNVRVCKW